MSMEIKMTGVQVSRFGSVYFRHKPHVLWSSLAVWRQSIGIL